MNPWTHRAVWHAALFTACVWVTACGRKAPPRPPEDVLPQTITDVHAADVTEGVRLSWTRPRTYADGTRMMDLAGFVVERAAGTDATAPFVRVATVAVTDRDRFRQVKRFAYVDAAVTVGTQYRYRVVSFTVDRYFSAPSNVVSVERREQTQGSDAAFPSPRG